MAVVIFDTFKGHTGSEMESLLLENNIISVLVPNSCTNVINGHCHSSLFFFLFSFSFGLFV